MKRPSFQFYPADYRNNSKLRRCSPAARGAWLDVMCVLHDQDEYGVCRWPLAELAQAAGVPVKLVRELSTKDVLKGADKAAPDYVFTPRHAGKDGEPVTLVVAGDGPCWYCSRFVRDEYVRQRRGATTRYSADNQPPKGAPKDGGSGDSNRPPKTTPKPPFGVPQGDGPSSPSPSSSTKELITPDGVIASPKYSAKAELIALGVAEQTAADWLALRKVKKAPVSRTALDAIKREAEKAGMTLDSTLALCCTRGWQGFKAEWVTQQAVRAGPGQAAGTVYAQTMANAERAKARIFGNAAPQGDDHDAG